MKKYIQLPLFILSFFILGFNAHTRAFNNDLQAIAKRPGSNELFIGGEFNTLLIVDANSGATLRQFTLTHEVLDLQFTPGGKELLVYDGDNVRYLNPDSGAESKSIEVDHVRFADGALYFIDLSWMDSKITVYNAADGTVYASFETDYELEDYGFSPDFSELIVLGKSLEISDESAMITRKIEKSEDYNVFNAAYADQQTDSEGAYFVVYDLKSRSEKLKTLIPYETSNSFDFNASKFGNNYYFACWDMLLMIDPTGKTNPIDSEFASFTYATSADPSGKYIFLADIKRGFVYNCEDASQKKFDGRQESEFSYSVDMTFDGPNAYLLSKDYTIIRLDFQGGVKAHLKVNLSSEGGFGVYYSNGFYKKEDRDKEAAIINKELEALGLPVIDLETKVGDSNVLLAVFGSMDEAEAFEKSINDRGLQYLTKIAPVAE